MVCEERSVALNGEDQLSTLLHSYAEYILFGSCSNSSSGVAYLSIFLGSPFMQSAKKHISSAL